MTMRLLCLGLSHKTAPVELRERLAFAPAQCEQALRELKVAYPACEAVILSTCNRAEIYTARPVHAHPREEDLREFLGRFHALPRDQYEGCLYALADDAAVRQLFRVAAGLDSLVPGEDQVLGQVKAALAAAEAQAACGGTLAELFQIAAHVAKHVRTETPLAAGRVSVAGAAVELARQSFADFSAVTVLSVGAGKMNGLMLRSLAKLGAADILVANRSAARAADLAAQCGGKVATWESLGEALGRADLVLCSTGASRPVISAEQVRAAMAGRGGREMLIIDIALPRDVEPGAAGVPGVRLFNIDDLQAVVAKNITQRLTGLEQAEEIVDQHVQEYFHRLHVREVAPAVEDLYKLMRQAADEELSAVLGRLNGDAAANQHLLRQAIHRALRSVLHRPIARLRAAAGTETARQQAQMLRKLFDLDESSHGERSQ